MAVTRVNPVRAVLEAHLRATWNRSSKEFGKMGALAFALLMGVALLAAAGPVIVGSSLFGYALLGKRIAEPDVFAPFLGGTLALLAFFGGIVGGILGGSRVLAWESYRVFPLRLRSLFAAELIACLGDPLCLAMSVMIGFLLLGVGLANSAVLPLVPLIWAEMTATMLCLQYLIGSLAARAVKRIQVGLILVAIVGWMGIYLVPAKVAARRSPAPEIAVQAQRVKAFGARLGRVVSWLPPSQASHGLSDAAQGRWGSALVHQLPLAISAAVLLLLTALTLRRESDQETLRVQASSRTPERLWSFAGPTAGVARLHWQNLLGSHLGRFSLLIPLMTLVLLKGPLAVAKGVHLWALPASFGYLALTGIQFQTNQFGLDGAGIKVLMLLPLRSREILEGKFWALAAYQGLQVLLLLILLGAGGLLTVTGAVAGICLAGCLFLVQIAFGHWTSGWLPRPMPRDSLKNSHQSPVVVWLGMALGSSAMAFFGGPFLLAAWLAPGLLLPLMAGLFALTAVGYWRIVLPRAADYLERRREALVDALG